MNTDFRISVSATSHPKILKLMRRCGDIAFFNLIKLWTFVAQNKPDGDLTGMDVDDIEIAAGWNGECSMFYQALLDLCLLDATEEGLFVHDWQDHNSFAAFAKERSEKAKRAAEARWGANKNTKAMPNNARSNADSMRQAMPNNARSNAPIPSPNPNPNPTPKDKDSCPEPSAKASEPQQAEQKAKPGNHDQPDLAIMTFPLAKKSEAFPVTQSDIDEWGGSFPGIDLLQELRHCLQWNRDNPTRRKTKAGIRRHITSWLAKAQDRARAPTSASPGQGGQTVRRTASQQYMHEVGELLEAIDVFDKNGCGQRVGATAPALPGGGAQRQIDQHTG